MTPLAIQSSFPCLVWLADDSYAEPTLGWLQGAFWSSFQADRFEKVGRYTRKNDCDNWARAYAQHAQDCHAVSAGSDADALAVGEIFYTQRTGTTHAIVCAFVAGERVFIEPQNGTVLALTPEEITSCIFVRF